MDIVPWEPESPSPYWRIRSFAMTAVAQRRGGPKWGMRVVLEHVKENGDKIQVSAIVDRQQTLATLKAFLDAARDLPAGIRIEAAVLESAPWDVIKAPLRLDYELDS